MYDTKEATTQWVVNGRIDPKGLAKALPETADALRNGALSPGEACLIFKGPLLESMKTHDTSGRMLPWKSNPSKNSDWMRDLCQHIDQTTFPMDHVEDEYKFFIDFGERIRNKGLSLIIFFDLESVQKICDEVAEKWEPRIKIWTGKPLKGTCSIYKVSKEEFDAFANRFVAENFDTSILHEPSFKQTSRRFLNKYVKIGEAAEGVSVGEDTISSTCWECDKEDSEVSKCSHCLAARYCSRECQTKR